MSGIVFAVALDFYLNLLARGQADAVAHNDVRAAQELRVASFGLLDDVPNYVKAQMILAIVSNRLGNKDEAHFAAARVAKAERLQPGAGAAIDPAIRTEFEKLQPVNVGRAPNTSPPPTPPTSVPPLPVRTESPPHVDDLMQRAITARQLLAGGDTIGAQNLAEGVIGRDINNGPAQAVLGTIAARAQNWSDAFEHFAIARTSVRLTPMETAAYNDTVAHRTRPKVVTSPPKPQPAPQPVAIQAAPAPPPPAAAAPESPLVAAAKHQPSQAPIVIDYSAKLAEADNLLRAGRPNAAKQIYLSLAAIPDLRRDVLLQVAQGLNQTSAWRDSSAAYRRTFPLLHGEEIHMFNEAVNRYELGDIQMARELLQKALPSIPETREVILYRGKILGSR